MASTAKTLTFVIPAYNMESYLDRCVNSLLSASDISDLEVLIVDDGSKDGTLEYARKLERTNPGAVRAIHQENKGHGGAVNTGIAAATGMYVKVVDADDWVDPQAIDTVLATLRAQHDTDEPIDMLVTNYVYDKVAKRHKTVVNFRRVMEAGRVLGWDDLGKFGLAQYIIMHALTFRTQVVRDSGLKLPEHTFYVDFYYSYQPFPWVKRIQYLDVPFYHYVIGREGQSVQTDVMIKRVDQLRLVNRLMTAVACRVALILRDGVRLLDPLALRPRAEPRRREFVFLLVFFCSCAITFLGFLLWCLCSVMQGRRAGNPYAAFRAYSSPAARMPSSALSS